MVILSLKAMLSACSTYWGGRTKLPAASLARPLLSDKCNSLNLFKRICGDIACRRKRSFVSFCHCAHQSPHASMMCCSSTIVRSIVQHTVDWKKSIFIIPGLLYRACSRQPSFRNGYYPIHCASVFRFLKTAEFFTV